MAMRVGRNEERQLCGDVDVDSTCGDFCGGCKSPIPPVDGGAARGVRGGVISFLVLQCAYYSVRT